MLSTFRKYMLCMSYLVGYSGVLFIAFIYATEQHVRKIKHCNIIKTIKIKHNHSTFY